MKQVMTGSLSLSLSLPLSLSLSLSLPSSVLSARFYVVQPPKRKSQYLDSDSSKPSAGKLCIQFSSFDACVS